MKLGDIVKGDKFKRVLTIVIAFIALYVVASLDFADRIPTNVDMMRIDNARELRLNEGDVVEYDFYPYSRFTTIKIGVYGYDNISNSTVVISREGREEPVFEGTFSDLKLSQGGEVVSYVAKKANKKDVYYHIAITAHLEDAKKDSGVYLSEREQVAVLGTTLLNKELITEVDEDGEIVEQQLSVGTSLKSDIPRYVFVFTIIYMFIAFCIIISVLNAGASAENLFITIFGCLSIIFFLYIPTYNMNDGLYHFTTSYHYSNVLMGEDRDEPCFVYMREDDAVAFVSDFRGDTTRYSPTARSLVDRYQNFSVFVKSAEMTPTYWRQSVLDENPVQYIPSILGMLLSRLLHLGTYPMLCVCFILNSLAYAIIGYFAIKISPVCKDAMVMIMCLPVAIQEGISMSYDSITIAWCMLTFAFITSLVVDNKKLSLKKWVLLAVDVIIMLCMKRMAYVTLFAILLWLINNEKLRKWLRNIFLVCISVAGVYFAAMCMLQKPSLYLLEDGEMKYPFLTILIEPITFFKLFVATLVEKFDYYACSPFGSWLGWDQEAAPVVVGIAFAIVLFVMSVNETKCDDYNWDKWKKWIAILVLIGSVLEMFIVLMTDTRIGRETIYGVQGRYFIPFMPVAALLISNMNITLDAPNIRKKCYTAYLVCEVVIVYYMMRTFLCR